MVEWERTVHRLVAQYRLAMADHVGEPAWRGLIARLSEASADFVRVWEEREVLGPENQTKLHHEREGGAAPAGQHALLAGAAPGSPA